jgi:putative glutathione S-transferase
MGRLVDGVWQDVWYDTASTGGRFVRESSAFGGRIIDDPAAEFAAEPGRYRLYVSLACPWAQRTLIVRRIKRLEALIEVAVVHPYMGDHGWTFEHYPGASGDPQYSSDYLYQLYVRALRNYTGRVTVPMLWDCERETIVNNESSEIIRILNNAFDRWGNAELDLYPAPLRAEIDLINAFVYERVNNGVYRAGFATRQEAYEEAVEALFAVLDDLEQRLAGQRYLVGERLTEADIRLFTTLVRFDAVYVGHFKCNVRRLVDYPNLWAYARELYQLPDVAETTDFDHIKRHYYTSHPGINPTGIIPVGPEVDWLLPHGREHLPTNTPGLPGHK